MNHSFTLIYFIVNSVNMIRKKCGIHCLMMLPWSIHIQNANTAVVVHQNVNAINFVVLRNVPHVDMARTLIWKVLFFFLLLALCNSVVSLCNSQARMQGFQQKHVDKTVNGRSYGCVEMFGRR